MGTLLNFSHQWDSFQQETERCKNLCNTSVELNCHLFLECSLLLSILRCLCSYFGSLDTPWHKIFLLIVSCLFQCHVVNSSDVKADLQNCLEEDDLAIVVRSKHRPRCIVEFILQSLEIMHLEEAKWQILVTTYAAMQVDICHNFFFTVTKCYKICFFFFLFAYILI